MILEQGENSRVAVAIRSPLELAVAETAHVDLSLPDISVQTIETLIKYKLERLFEKRPKPRKKSEQKKDVFQAIDGDLLRCEGPDDSREKRLQ
jgi:hypothetical protein